ncbi:hypothetical protein [Christiangramia echinicola]|uniref:hypothetical protein n=1 Tax=Christiangramia echinicola TaxID=279359 RepID=UPI000411371E|nr:hypothetical protein [Christiangramia echinicola]
MPAITTDYSNTCEEIKYYHKQILEEANHNSKIKELYKGCQILFSPLHPKPKFLLIGFNPGGGYYKWHGEIVEQFKPMPALEYYLNKHTLGEQTKTLFKKAGKNYELEHSTVKINFYTWATDNVSDFNELMRLLPKELSANLFHYSRVWTKQLIESIQPEYIICEGFKAFDEIEVLFSDKSKVNHEEHVRSFMTVEGTKIIGYKRNQGSIIGKSEIANYLNKF